MGSDSLVVHALASELTGVHEGNIYSHPYLLWWLVLTYALIVSHGTFLSEVGTISDLLFLLESPLDRISQ